MTTGMYTICVACKHLIPGSDDTPPSCAAFPNGIPDAIMWSGYDHRRPWPGDGGVLFELRPGSEGDLAAFTRAPR